MKTLKKSIDYWSNIVGSISAWDEIVSNCPQAGNYNLAMHLKATPLELFKWGGSDSQSLWADVVDTLTYKEKIPLIVEFLKVAHRKFKVSHPTQRLHTSFLACTQALEEYHITEDVSVIDDFSQKFTASINRHGSNESRVDLLILNRSIEYNKRLVFFNVVDHFMGLFDDDIECKQSVSQILEKMFASEG